MIKSPIRKLAVPLFLLAAALPPCLSPPPAAAWGPSGHRIVGLVAEKHLNGSARARVRQILGDETLADVANWADEVRTDATAPLHFVNLPKNLPASQRRLDRARDCKDIDGGPGCAVTAIEKYHDILAGRRAGDRAEALKFLVHFVGDLHQPLHVSFREDRGGNNIKVTFFRRQSNLHKVWDSGIIGRAQLNDDEFAAELEAALNDQSGDEEFETANETTRQKIARLQGGTVDDWANESFRLALSNAYDAVPRNGTARLGQAYYDSNWKVVDDQLTKAGLRLAKLLNDALGGN